MTGRPARTAPGELLLAPESIEAVARRVAELLSRGGERPAPRRLLTAAEVSQWWGVKRSWVYAHADRLGARRLGAGERPRLRFDPDEVAERLGSPTTTGSHDSLGDRRRSPRIGADSTVR